MVAAVLFLCGCDQNSQTIITMSPTAESEITGQVTTGLSVTPNEEVTQEPVEVMQPTLTSLPTPDSKGTAATTFIPEPTVAITVTPEPEPTQAIMPPPTPAPTDEPALTPTAMPTVAPILTKKEEPASTVTLPLTKTEEPTLTLTPSPVPTQAVVPLEGAVWCELYREDTKIQMTRSEISVLNEQNFRIKETNLVKLSEIKKVEAETVVKMIESYSFPNYKYYGNEKISQKTKQEILNKRNLTVLQDEKTAELRFGILTQNTDLRSFPAEKPLTSEKNGRYDYLQETMLYLNEAVVVLHTSTDGKWCFVQAENYYGWIREENIAYCDKETMQKHYEALFDTENEDVLIVTENIYYEPETDEGYWLRMGTKLLCETHEEGELVVNFPIRAEENQLQTIQYSVSFGENGDDFFHRGYLPYTTSNVVTLATELLETPYAWGDSLTYKEFYSYENEIGMDCSSTMVAVYRCFGFVMPRNTGAQREMARESERVKGYDTAKKKEVLSGVKAGTLLYSPGHVMLYLGSYEGEHYVLHNTTSEHLSDGTEERYYRCVISPLSLGKKGNTILEQLLEIKALVQ